MNTWYTGDEHNGHGLLQKMRGFASVREMEEALIANHNAVVRKDDRVIHVGDFAYRGDPKRARAILQQLNGSHFLIIGNHDDRETLSLPWAGSPQHMTLLKDRDVRLCIGHYAMRTWPGYHRGVIHLFGHSHGRIPPDDRSCDVGVDAWNLMPTNIAQIQARLAMSPPHEDPETGTGPNIDDGGPKL